MTYQEMHDAYLDVFRAFLDTRSENMQQYALSIESLVKTYNNGKIMALNDFSIDIPKGTIYGIIGRNGAGKSTLIKCIIGFLKPDSGKIRFNGDMKNRIGYMPENIEVYDFMTGMDFLELIAELRRINKKELHDRIEDMQEYIELPNMDMLTSSYSKGNLEKLVFLAAFIHSPEVVILDEPFTGFDPAASIKAKEFLKNYAEKGNTIIISTHILEMAAYLCDHILIIDKGIAKKEFMIKAMGTMEERLDILKDLFK